MKRAYWVLALTSIPASQCNVYQPCNPLPTMVSPFRYLVHWNVSRPPPPNRLRACTTLAIRPPGSVSSEVFEADASSFNNLAYKFSSCTGRGHTSGVRRFETIDVLGQLLQSVLQNVNLRLEGSFREYSDVGIIAQGQTALDAWILNASFVTRRTAAALIRLRVQL